MEIELKSYTAEDFEKEREELERAVSVKKDRIVLNVRYEYNVPIADCDTHEKILGWTFHLAEKTWMSRRLLRRFIEVACVASNLPIPHT